VAPRSLRVRAVPLTKVAGEPRATIGRRSGWAFLALIVAQAAHSIEEYIFRLFDVFAPARFVSGLVSSNLEVGFAVANAALVSFGIWCYFARVRPGHPSAPAFAWFWTLLEFANAAGHSLLALSRGAYFPGVATAPVLLGVSAYLAFTLTGTARTERPIRGVASGRDDATRTP
jgi:hypothetical protein